MPKITRFPFFGECLLSSPAAARLLNLKHLWRLVVAITRKSADESRAAFRQGPSGNEVKVVINKRGNISVIYCPCDGSKTLAFRRRL